LRGDGEQSEVARTAVIQSVRGRLG